MRGGGGRLLFCIYIFQLFVFDVAVVSGSSFHHCFTEEINENEH